MTNHLPLVVHHQCYRSPGATEHAIKTFLRFNPNVPYVLWSDSGDDYSTIASKYNLDYNYSSANVGYCGYSVEQVRELFSRIRETSLKFQPRLILWMEDDVLTRGIVSPDSNIESSCIPAFRNHFPKHCLQYLSDKYQLSSVQQWYGMAGGSLLNGDLFRSKWELIVNFIEIDYPYLLKISGPKIAYWDVLFQLVHIIAAIPCDAGSYVNEYKHRFFADPRRIIDRFKTVPMLHNYKAFY